MLTRGAAFRLHFSSMNPIPGASAPTGPAALALRVAREYRKHALDPVDRFSEAIFGLIMVLAFTCSMSVAEGGSQGVRQMLVAALGCNLAWGLVDAVMYVLTSIAERARRAAVLQGIRAAEPALARHLVLATLPEGFLAIADDAAADRLVARFRAAPAAGAGRAVTRDDLRGALASALLVLVATFPPTLPFLLVRDPVVALRVSNGVAVACLFLAGYWLGQATGVRAWRLGLAMVVLGSGMVAVTVALGG
jgi:VIT1/CCC1 family predicted Fe2+/Mn2+ transporter